MKAKQLATPHKERSRNVSAAALVPKRPHAVESSAPEKVRNITVCHKRDALALAEILAASATPLKLTEEAAEILVDSAEALYHDFQARDSVNSTLAKLMCGISSSSMDALSRARRCQSLEQREMELKSATRGALAIAELTKVYDARRASSKHTVNVSQVNVEAGGQAVVGNVTSDSSKAPQIQEMLPLQPKIEDPTSSQK